MIYLSVDRRSEATQVDELTAAGSWHVWSNSASGALDRRPQLVAVLEQLRPWDTLVV